MVDESDCSDSGCRFGPPDRPGVAPVTTQLPAAAMPCHASASLSIDPDTRQACLMYVGVISTVNSAMAATFRTSVFLSDDDDPPAQHT